MRELIFGSSGSLEGIISIISKFYYSDDIKLIRNNNKEYSVYNGEKEITTVIVVEKGRKRKKFLFKQAKKCA